MLLTRQFYRSSVPLSLYSGHRYVHHQINEETFNKKLLAPLVKKIHPDYYMNDGDIVRTTNLSCLQNVNELWESIDALSRKNTTGDSISITAPFKLAYALKCYVRVDNKGVEKVIKKERMVKVPLELCTRGNTIAVARKPGLIRKILKQFGQFYIDLNVPNPWEATTDSATGEESPDSSSNDELGLDGYEKKMELRMLERAIKHSYRFANTVKQENIYNKVDELLAKSGLKTKFDPKFASLKDNEIDVFVRYGNVMSKDLSLVEEYHTLTKFHKFLREYAALLNFQLDYWKSIIFIIYQNDTPITVSNRQRKKALKEGNLDIHSHLYKVETMEDLLQGSVGSDTSTSKDILRVDVHGKEHRIKFIVSIPHDYIDRFLLEFLRQHLPLTNHFYTVKKDENI